MANGSVVDKTESKQTEETDILDSLNIVTAVELKDIALVCIANLIFNQLSDEPVEPGTAEEQLLYDARLRLTQQSDLLLPVLENTIQHPSEEDIALVYIAHHYQLNWVEILTLALCRAVESDAMIGRTIAYVQAPLGISRPTLGLLESALAPLVRDITEISETATNISTSLLSGKASEIGLLQCTNSLAPTPEQALQIPQTIAMALQGSWKPIKGTSITSAQDTVSLPVSISQQVTRHASALGKAKQRALIIRSTSSQEANTIVNLIAAQLQTVPLFINSIKYSVDKIEEPIGILCVIANLLPVFRLPLHVAEDQYLPDLLGYEGPVLAIAQPDGVIRSDTYSVMNWLVPIPEPDERQDLWLHYISDRQLARDLARDHMHSAGRIAELAEVSSREADLDQRDSQTIEDIHKAAWSNCSDDLSALAEAVPGRIDDDALILNSTTDNDLQMLLQRSLNRESLVENLGVSLTNRYQPGVCSLFIGPSGTGKTLAAAWLATKLAMPLYRVDLASVMSKYIGETEKNLASLFAKAERSDVILLFDEADSLFGKRTDIKDSNDRYANTQTNYLLQRIENYQGIVLLTSNSRSRFDSAFTRRIDLIIEFPAPGPQQRRALWQSHLGSHHQLSAVQINQLSAVLDICGGHIRNAVLAAAVLAHKEQRVIHYDDVIRGLKIEYKKMSKKLPLELSKDVKVL